MEWRCRNCGASHPRNQPPCHRCGGMDFERAVVRMEYRCVACGEPAVEPTECEGCGASEFERIESSPDPAVDAADEVRVRPGASSTEPGDAIAWDCTECGKRHVRNSPPCNRCGAAPLERVDLDAEGAEADPAYVGEAGGTGALLVFPDALATPASVLGLALVVLGGGVALYGGHLGTSTEFYRLTGRLPPDARWLLAAGLLAAAVGAAMVFVATRSTSPDDV